MTPPTGENSQDQSFARCPVCKNPVIAGSVTFPFCSQRCQQIDLGKWVSGDYVISRPVEQADLDEV